VHNLQCCQNILIVTELSFELVWGVREMVHNMADQNEGGVEKTKLDFGKTYKLKSRKPQVLSPWNSLQILTPTYSTLTSI